jgi:uncharacterized protein YcaQ
MMDMIVLTKQQARQFLLMKQGLIGDYKFAGKQGVLEFVRQAGCIQYDPIDVCGKNAELVLQARVKGFTKQMLYELLYKDRLLLDYFDKNLAIVDIKDWPYLNRIRESYRMGSRGREEVDKVAQEIKLTIAQKGPISSKDLDFNEKIDWYWSSTKLSRAALETLYFRGDLIIHHKRGTNKYYALAEDYVSQELLTAPEPFPEELDHMKWRVLRRISAVGLLWNKPSDAWLYIQNFKAGERSAIFETLEKEQKIIKVSVEGCKDNLYCLAEDLSIIREIQETAIRSKERTELIAPLDSFLWDRKLVKELFAFDYKWEIYTPQEQRKYGYYVLPILSGENLIGRTETIADSKEGVLRVKNIWLEPGIRSTKKLEKELERCFIRFMKFHMLQEIIYDVNVLEKFSQYRNR